MTINRTISLIWYGIQFSVLPSCVIQMDPLPMPTLRPSTPASMRFLAWAAVTTETKSTTNQYNI